LKENFLPHDLPIDSRDNVLVIFGSESKGLEEDVYNLANYNVIIPPFLGSDISSKNDASSIVDSLNVGVSSGIIIHSIKVKLT
jgi:tRNA G18 (ribose-2'-O)-methylase SpoU